MMSNSRAYYLKNKSKINEYNRKYYREIYKNKDKEKVEQLKGCIIQRNVVVYL